VKTSRQKHGGRKICISLVLFLGLSQMSCASSPDSERAIQQRIVDYLSATFGQPQDNVWEEGKTYFLRDRHGIEPLGRAREQIEGVRVFRAAVWMLHWAPERFPVVVWMVTKNGELQMGLLDSPGDIATKFPRVLQGMVFDQAATRRRLARLVGEMVQEFYSHMPKGRLAVFSEAECEWVENAAVGSRGRIAASCFSGDGALERIILASTRSPRPEAVNELDASAPKSEEPR
jgi:hypothetical protein